MKGSALRVRALAHLDVAEDMVALRLKVVFHERLLPTTIPQVEDEIAKETHMGVFNVDGCTKTHGIPCQVVCKYDRSHGGLACTRLTHQQDLLQHSAAWNWTLGTLTLSVSRGALRKLLGYTI